MEKRAKSVDEYLKLQPLKFRKLLSDVRRTILKTCPEAVEKIGYGMPYYSYCGRLIYFAGFKDHFSLYAWGSSVKKLEKELKPFMSSKATLKFTDENPIPLKLVEKIVKARMKDNLQK
ncbi:MAG: iron chaperone [Candidatus Pacearchaeota archaeon]